MSQRPLVLLFVVLAAAVLASAGCSKSSTSQASSESSSDSSRGSSKSSRSSSGSSGKASYVGDVRDATREWALGGTDSASFKRELAQIAESAGITDWESDEDTYEGIGRGLKRTGVKGARLEELKRDLGRGNAQHMQWIQKGFDRERA
ncbi:MAG: putative lipoprotein [Myxococcota bacterium]|nr:putative lipoprotein [Myxococcota bacterium]